MNVVASPTLLKAPPSTFTSWRSRLASAAAFQVNVGVRSWSGVVFMRFVGATLNMEQRMNEWILDIHPSAVQFEVQ